ncbi:MAG: hypothetical protein ACI91B_003171 [Planctomycetota bacterium]|jgi:hypothetical protein
MRFLALWTCLLHSCGMRHLRCLWLIALAGCTAPPSSAYLLTDAEPNQDVRLAIIGNRVTWTAVPIDLRAVPALARTTCEAIAPNGVLEFCAREVGPRGEGFRLEKRYEQPFSHLRSMLVDELGNVMERSHTVPVAKVPQDVLSAALRSGTLIESTSIVSGPVHEEFWRIVTKDRRGRTFVITVDLDGNVRSQLRRNQSRVDS